jgi:uncharacterized protein
VFGWQSESNSMPDMPPYTTWTVPGQEQGVAGLFEYDSSFPPDMPSFWMPYFCVENADASRAKATTLGADLRRDVTEIPGVGRFAVFMDPQGAGFSILELAPMG